MSTSIIKPEWSFITIALMVLGFVLWWPLGLAVLAYILWGERFGGSSDKAERWIHKQKGEWNFRKGRRRGRHSSGNVAFDEYREEQLKRLEEERRRLDEEINQFQGFVHNLRMARDREEFDRFMRDRGENQSEPRYSDSDDVVEGTVRSKKRSKRD